MEQVDLVAHYCDFQQEGCYHRLNMLRPFFSEEDIEKVEASYQPVVWLDALANLF